MKTAASCIAALLVGLSVLAAQAQPSAKVALQSAATQKSATAESATAERDWWKNAVIYGDDVMLDTSNTKVLSWMCEAPGVPAVVVSANFTAEPQTVNLGAIYVPGVGLRPERVRTLLKSPGGQDPASLDRIELAPFGVYIGEVR